jgi:tetratricopeptide (TPR) repeat protein
MIRVTALLASLALLASACQPVPTSTSKPSGPSDPLAAADLRLFSGDYDGAESAYKKLIDGGDALAQAHYALLLDYENRFSEAVVQARAASSANPGSISLARLTRALDWSEDITGALDAGSRAVTSTPVDPLAHVYYAEVLADTAHFELARTELQAGEKAAHDAYTAAEIDREWSNYYRGKSDPLEELNHLQLSLKAQPGFPERMLELVRFHYTAKKPDTAKALLAGLRKRHSRDYGVNVAAGDTAFLHGDAPSAESFYQAALKVRPNGPAASLGLAELDVAVKRDFNAAHDLLLGSLKANPDSADVYTYLRFLDLLLLKTDPAKELAPIQPATPPALAAQRKEAFDRVNAYRSALGLGVVTEAAAISESALAHSYFYLFNFGEPAVQNIKVHEEDPTLPGAFGGNSIARAQHFGYTGKRMSEVISHAYLPKAAVDRWVDTVFHRYPITDPESGFAGYGQAQVGALSIQVLDFDRGDATKQGLVVYPAPDQRNVPSAFLGGEIPDPAPNARYPTGYPITMAVGSGSTLAVTAAELDGPDGKAINGYVISSGAGGLSANEWAVLPRDPLLPAGVYTMKVAGTIDGKTFTKVWSFTATGS